MSLGKSLDGETIFAEGDWGALVASGGVVHLLSPCCRGLDTTDIENEDAVICCLCSSPLPSIYRATVFCTETDAPALLAVLMEELTGQRWDRRFAVEMMARMAAEPPPF